MAGPVAEVPPAVRTQPLLRDSGELEEPHAPGLLELLNGLAADRGIPDGENHQTVDALGTPGPADPRRPPGRRRAARRHVVSRRRGAGDRRPASEVSHSSLPTIPAA